MRFLKKEIWKISKSSRTRTKRTDGFNETSQRFPRPHFREFWIKVEIQNPNNHNSIFPLNPKHSQSQCPVKKCIQVCWEWINTRKEFGRNWEKWLLKWIISIRDILDWMKRKSSWENPYWRCWIESMMNPFQSNFQI